MHRGLVSLNGRRHSHTHSTSRAPSLSVRLTATILFGLFGAPVLPLALAAPGAEDSSAAVASRSDGGAPQVPAVTGDTKQDPPAPASPGGQPSEAASNDRLRRLVDSLGDSSYAIRESATKELVAAGEAALPELRRGLESADPEVRRRAGSVIDRIAARAAVPEGEREDGLRRRLRDLPELADPAFEEAMRRFEEMFRRFDRPFPPSLPGRDELFGGSDLAELEKRIAELREEMQRRFQSFPEIDPLGLFEEGSEPFSFGEGAGSGSSRVQIWRDGEKVFDSASNTSFAEASQLGVVVESVHPSLRAHLPVPEGQGVIIADIAPGSRAERAGLQVHDILLTAAGTPIADAIALRTLLRDASGPGIELGLLRRGAAITVNVPLAEPGK